MDRKVHHFKSSPVQVRSSGPEFALDRNSRDRLKRLLRLITRRAYGFHSAQPLIALALLSCGAHRPHTWPRDMTHGNYRSAPFVQPRNLLAAHAFQLSMRTTALTLLVLLIAGCGQAPTAQASTPAATPHASPPSVGFSCRLPVASTQPDGRGGYTEGGFLSFPGASFQGDPAANRAPAYFNRAISKWLPVDGKAVSPDGSHYATTTGGFATQQPAKLHLVEASTGKEQVISLPATRNPLVLDYEATTVYLTESEEGGNYGLWRVSVSTGRVDKASDQSGTQAVAGNGLWFGELNPLDPGPFPPGSGGGPDTLKRWDLSSRTTTLWFYRPASNVYLLGLDRDGAAVIMVLSANGQRTVASSELLLVSRPGQETRIFSVADVFNLLEVIADEHGLWLGSNKGIFLYSRDAGMRKVSDYVGVPANGCN